MRRGTRGSGKRSAQRDPRFSLAPERSVSRPTSVEPVGVRPSHPSSLCGRVPARSQHFCGWIATERRGGISRSAQRDCFSTRAFTSPTNTRPSALVADPPAGAAEGSSSDPTSLRPLKGCDVSRVQGSHQTSAPHLRRQVIRTRQLGRTSLSRGEVTTAALIGAAPLNDHAAVHLAAAVRAFDLHKADRTSEVVRSCDGRGS